MQETTNSCSITRGLARGIFCFAVMTAEAGCSTTERPYGLYSQTSYFEGITVATVWSGQLKVTDARMSRVGGISTAQVSITDPNATIDRRYVARATWYDDHDNIVQPDILFVENGMLSPFNTATTVWKGPNPQARRVVVDFTRGE
jgi:hypothetical protein